MLFMFFVQRHKAQQLRVEVEFDLADWSMAMLGKDKLSNIGGHKIVIVLFVVIRTMQKHDEVGVLLD